MKPTAIEQAKDHRDEVGKDGEYQLVMHTDTLITILNGTKIGVDSPGVFNQITADDLPIDEVLLLHGASIHLDDRVLVGAVNRRPC